METINFAACGDTFPRFSALLDVEEYRYNILLGFTVSVGGLTESLVRALSAWLHHLFMLLRSVMISLAHYPSHSLLFVMLSMRVATNFHSR